MQFKKAVKHERKLRLAFIGPAGSGKTLTALKVASGLGGKIGFIDTEQGSAAIYADQFDFDQLVLDTFAPSTYVDAIRAAADTFDVLIIDSLSHAWTGKNGALEQVDRSKSHGGGFGAWRNVTPQHNAMVEAILTAPSHVITTIRSKIEYVQEKDQRGKTQIRKVGMQPVQRDGLEYEFDIVGDIDQTHTLTISKTRYSGIADRVIAMPGEPLGVEIQEWLQGVEAPAPEEDEEPSAAVPEPSKAVQQAAEPQLAAIQEQASTRAGWDYFESFLRPLKPEKARIGEFQYYWILDQSGVEGFPPRANKVPKKPELCDQILGSIGPCPDVSTPEGLANNVEIAGKWFERKGAAESFTKAALKEVNQNEGTNEEHITSLWTLFEEMEKQKYKAA